MCNCKAGFMGNLCQEECINGNYGHSCAQKCLCQNEALCDHVSGACICSPGFTGSLCEKSKAFFNHTSCLLLLK
ncbi:hypothetical protein XENORESO_008158 [Xenotaenia resolanae]|uniref:EGF-like domain-containing protein n=1 Tax=Xenotaenia resolanae TaxID=208358 RepID=A0ABV0VPM9_9TELE